MVLRTLAKLTEKVGCDFSIHSKSAICRPKMQRRWIVRIFKGCMAAIWFASLSCSVPFVPQNYFPVQQNNRWVFNGPLKTLLITEQEEAAPVLLFRIASVDSQDTPISWLHCRQAKDAVEWTAFEPFQNLLPTFRFDPPLLLTPFSDQIGAKKIVQGIEICENSATTACRVRVIYAIDSIEAVRVPAGDFPECIKMRMSILYLETPERHFLANDVIWWFARDVGPVRYSMISGQGELQSAKVGGKNWP